MDEEIFTLELLHVTDQEATGATLQDIPRLSAVLNALRDEDLGKDGVTDNTITLSSGDAFIPGLFFSASEAAFGAGGIADIEIQNQLGFEAVALGNHEFDFGTQVLSELITGQSVTDGAPASIGTVLDAEFGGANFPYLSTNLDFAPDPFLAPLEVAGGLAPEARTVTSSVVLDVNGEQIGVIGATTPTLGSISSPDDVGVSPTPFGATPTAGEIDALAAIIQSEVDAVLAANPELNKVVLLAHMQQISIEIGLAERLENVDIIVAGGSNTRLLDDDDRLRDGDTDQGQYPQFFTNAGGTITAVVNTDGSYKYVGRLVVDFDADGNIIAESYDETISGAYATDAQGVADLGAADLVDPEIAEIVAAIEAEIIATEGNVFGVSDVFLNGNRSGDPDAPGDADGVRTQETNLGNLTADANLAYAQTFDASVVASVKNGGGIRASIGETVVPPGGTDAVRTANSAVLNGDGDVIKPEGGISQNDIETTLAFNNGLTLLTLSRTELAAVLEHSVSGLPEVSGRFGQFSGIEFSFDPDFEVGSRVQNAAIVDDNGNVIAELVRDGVISGDPDEGFRIVTLDFLAAPRFDDAGNFIGGGDGYPFPNTDDPDVAARVNPVALENKGVTTGDALFADDGTEQDALAEYLQDNFLETPFSESDTGRDEDGRVQNLNFREDAVFDSIVEPVFNEILGSNRSDFLQGTDDADDIMAMNGPDLILAGGGNDKVDAGRGRDAVFGGDGDDMISGGNGLDFLVGDDGDDTIDGGNGRDDLFGGLGNDSLFGGNGSDFIDGGEGDDIIDGGNGRDSVIGGAGADTFVLSSARAGNAMFIDDFTSGEDSFGLSGEAFAAIGSISAETFAIGGRNSADTDDVRLIYNDRNGRLFYDEDGSGNTNAVFIAQLNNVSALSADDFFIV